MAPTSGSGTAEDPYTLPWFSLSELGTEFVTMAYQAGWILEDFDWASWAHGLKGQLIANDRAALASADPEQLAKLLTAVVRQDRFVEGALSDAYDTGLLLALAKRAQALCGDKGS
jgi:hypothetical protein